MESWSYVSGVNLSQEGIDNQRIDKLVNHNNQIRDSLTSNIGSGRVFSSVKVPNSAFFDDSESSSKVLRSVLKSNCEDSSLIDLKLGRFFDLKDAESFKSPMIMANLSSNVPAKRMRTGGLNYQIPCCQVQGCGKDLRSSKDYHKRHKVCEVHSKTAKVIVNGIEQRFCQQCSRFHLLDEFDNGKRSCRKRLAGHNERRRKPHTGTRFRQTSFARSSSICQNILGSCLQHQPKYEMKDWYRNVKVGDAADYGPRLTMPFANGHSQPKSIFTSYRAEKQHPPLHDEGITALTRSKIDKSSKSYLHGVGGSDFVTCSLLQSTSIGGKVLHVLDSASAIQGLSGTSNSSCALSLLSPQSQYSYLVPTAHHLRTPSSNAHHNVTCISEQLPQVVPQALSSGVSGFNPAEVSSSFDCLEQILVSNSSSNCGINGFIQGSEYVNTNDQISREDGSTVNLLQRVEHQSRFVQMIQ